MTDLDSQGVFLVLGKEQFSLQRSGQNAGNCWKKSVQKRGTYIAAKTSGKEKGVASFSFFQTT